MLTDVGALYTAVGEEAERVCVKACMRKVRHTHTYTYNYMCEGGTGETCVKEVQGRHKCVRYTQHRCTASHGVLGHAEE